MDSGLSKILQCPDCSGILGATEAGFFCSSCGRKYENKNGIILLYPEKFDLDHLQEEKELAAEMRAEDRTEKEKLSAEQWQLSKNEFWGIVKKESGLNSGSIVNVGCGYDKNFKFFQDQGFLFINFDLVPEILESLKNEGAKNCVAGDIHSLPFSEDSFACLVCIDVIHHESENLENIIGSFYKVLKPGGKIFLEDVNAWGLWQFYKSIFLPPALYRFARALYHKIKKTSHQPADYEFPTNPFKIRLLLEKIGFKEVKFWPLDAYPNHGRLALTIYRLLAGVFPLKKFHNFHYLVSAVKEKTGD
jgi:SAM-dependent methyltransferase